MKSIIQHKSSCFSKKISDWELEEFFTKSLEYFGKELQKTDTTFYKYKENVDGDLFKIIERTWLGLFNNAIIRAFGDQITTLQEFNVWNSQNKVTGRCDLLINWKKVDMLIEGKCHEFLNNWRNFDDFAFYSHLERKSTDFYFTPEEPFYQNRTIGIILVFEWVRNRGKRLEEAMSAVESLNMTNQTDFCAFFHDQCAGVIIYGHIFNLKNAS